MIRLRFKNYYKILSLFFIFIWLQVAYPLSFNVPKAGEEIVGRIQTAQVLDEEDFSDVAQRFGVGYYEVFEANPGVNPDSPISGTALVIPTRYILPRGLKKDTAIINLAEMRLYYKNKEGSSIHIFPVGIGKEGWETPMGKMSIVEKIKNPTWMVPESIYRFRVSIGDKIKKVIPPGPDNPLGKYALRLSRREYLIHGTNAPSGIGRRSTAGCIRLYPEDIEQLYSLVSIGTKFIIINQPYKAGWHKNKLYLETHMPLFEQRIGKEDDIKSGLDVVSVAAKGHNVKINWEKVRRIIKEHIVIPRSIT